MISKSLLYFQKPQKINLFLGNEEVFIKDFFLLAISGKFSNFFIVYYSIFSKQNNYFYNAINSQLKIFSCLTGFIEEK